MLFLQQRKYLLFKRLWNNHNCVFHEPYHHSIFNELKIVPWTYCSLPLNSGTWIYYQPIAACILLHSILLLPDPQGNHDLEFCVHHTLALEYNFCINILTYTSYLNSMYFKIKIIWTSTKGVLRVLLGLSIFHLTFCQIIQYRLHRCVWFIYSPYCIMFHCLTILQLFCLFSRWWSFLLIAVLDSYERR